MRVRALLKRPAGLVHSPERKQLLRIYFAIWVFPAAWRNSHSFDHTKLSRVIYIYIFYDAMRCDAEYIDRTAWPARRIPRYTQV